MDEYSQQPAPRDGAWRDTSGAADDRAWGPVEAHGGRRRRWPRRLALLVVVLLAVPVAWGWALASRGMDAMGRDDVPGLAARSGPRTNVLLTGSDSREDLTPEERQELATGDADGTRTDVIMVLSTTTSSADLLAFPRDLWVERCDGSIGRINAALAHGGMACLVETVEDLSGIPVHHTMAIDFGGFRDLVDTLGGVELCTEQDFVDPKAGLDLAAGCHLMDGPTALGFVRTRQLDNDLMRMERQQQFLGRLVATMASRDHLWPPPHTWDVVGAAGSVVTADQDLGMVAAGRIGLGARTLAGDLSPQIVPSTPDRINGAAVLIPDLVAAEPMFAALRGDEPQRDAADATPLAAVTPARVRVAVLNGTSVQGLAGQVGDRLAADGWDVVLVGNGPDAARTRVVGSTDDSARGAATAVAADLPGDPVTTTDAAVDDVRLGADADVVVVLGPDAAGS